MIRRFLLTLFKNWKESIAILGLGMVLIGGGPLVWGAPPASPYGPGETLDPSCAPGDANCTVTGPLSGASTSTFVPFYQTSSTLGGDSALTFNSSTKTLTVGTSTITNFTFTNASGTNVSSTNFTASGYLQGVTLYISGQSSLQSVSSTNLLATGYLNVSGQTTMQGISFTSASGTNQTLSGYLQVQNLFDQGGNKYVTSTAGAAVTSISSGTFISASNATGSVTLNFANPGFVTAASSVIWSANQTFAATSTFSSSTIVNGQLTFGSASGTNLTASGYLQGVTLYISGQSNLQSASSTNLLATGYLNVSGQTTVQGISFTSASGTNISATGYGLFPTLSFTAASGTNLGVTGYGMFPTLVDSQGNRYSTSTGDGSGVATGTGAAAGRLSFFLDNNTISGSSSLVYTSSTGLLQVFGTASSTEVRTPSGTVSAFRFTNASGTNLSASGYLQGAALSISGQSSLASVSGVTSLQFASSPGAARVINIAASGLDLAATSLTIEAGSGTADAVDIAGGTLLLRGGAGDSAGGPAAGGPTIVMGGNAETSGRGGNVTIVGGHGAGTGAGDAGGDVIISGGGGSSTLASAVVNIYGGRFGSNLGTISLNASGTALGKVGVGTSSPWSVFSVAGNPLAAATSTLVLLGNNFITGGSASGTFLGANPNSGFNGDLLNLQVDSSTKLLVTSSSVAIATSTRVSGALFTVATTTNIFTILQSGHVGVGTSSPVSLFTVARGTDFFNVLSTGLVGVATSSPKGRVHVVGIATSSGTGTVTSTAIFGNTLVKGTGTAVFSTELDVGYVIGTADQFRTVVAISGTRDLLTDTAFSPALTNATSFSFQPPSLRVQDSLGSNSLIVTAQGNVIADTTSFGSMVFPEDAGLVTWVDMSVSSTAAAVPVGYSAALDGTPLLTMYGEADGAGSVRTPRVGIYTTAPKAIFHIATSSPKAATSSLVFLGDAVSGSIIGGSTNGTHIGINTTGTYSGDFLNFQVNSSSKLLVQSSGSLAIATGTLPGGALFHVATSTSILTILQNGGIGIGTTTFSYGLVVGDGATQKDVYIPKGAICVDVNATGCPTAPTAGTVYASSTVISGIDVAENYSTSEISIEAGEIVASDPSQAESIIKSTQAYQANVLGVISTSPGVLLGRRVEQAKPVALVGRVPLKVNGEGGVIVPGDYITASSEPGVGMKAAQAGRVVGIALTGFDPAAATSSPGRIIVFVNPQWYVPASAGDSSGQPVTAVVYQGGAQGSYLNNSSIDPNMIYSFGGIKVQKLEVGSAESPSGITIYDRKSKAPFCIVVEDGVLKSLPGACEAQTSSTNQQTSSGISDMSNQSTTSSTDSGYDNSSSTTSGPAGENSSSTMTHSTSSGQVTPSTLQPGSGQASSGQGQAGSSENGEETIVPEPAASSTAPEAPDSDVSD